MESVITTILVGLGLAKLLEALCAGCFVLVLAVVGGFSIVALERISRVSK